MRKLNINKNIKIPDVNLKRVYINENMPRLDVNIKPLNINENMKRLYINKNIKRILIIAITLILCSNLISILNMKSQAASIQIVPSTSRITSVTVSTSFQTCRDLDSLTSTLGTTALDPHLSTNRDWGAVSYLANSIYGVNATYDSSNQGKVGKKVTIKINPTDETGIEFFSTTPNITGVMNWGGNPRTATYSQTAGLMNAVAGKTDAQAVYDLLKDQTTNGYNGKDTYNNIKLLVQPQYKDSRYVEKLVSSAQSQGMAIGETSGWGNWLTFSTYQVFPMCARNGLFGFNVGINGGYGTAAVRPGVLALTLLLGR